MEQAKTLHVAVQPSSSDQSNMKRKHEEMVSPSFSSSPTGLSVNWNLADQQDRGCDFGSVDVELTVGARGIRQGKKPKSPLDYIRLESRLCRNQLRALVDETTKNTAKPTSASPLTKTCQPVDTSPQSYTAWKADLTSPRVRQIRQLVFKSRPFDGWLEGAREDEPLRLVLNAKEDVIDTALKANGKISK